MRSHRARRARRWLVAVLFAPALVQAQTLHELVRADDLPALRRQLATPSGVDAADADGLTPLILAILSGHREAVTLLLAAGADANVVAEIQGRGLARVGIDVPADVTVEGTPLLAAVMRGDATIAGLLLQAGADPRRRLGDATPLHLAAERGSLDVVRSLLAAGAEVDATVDSGPTPLLVAVDNGHDAVVNLLIAAGADGLRADGEGRTPLSEAIRRADADMIAALSHATTAALADLGGGPIDVEGHASASRALAHRPVDVAVSAATGRICWSDYAGERIDCVDRNGGAQRSYTLPVAGAHGLAFDATGAHLYWTADRSFPRAVGRLDLAGGAATVLVAGAWVNRPRAITFDAAGDTLWWSERVSGRLRRRSGVGAPVDVVRTDVANPADPESAALSILGIALAGDDEIVWSDLAGQRLERARRDGSARRTVAGPGEGVVFPVGVAVDASGAVWWSDAARGEILRLLPGGSPGVVLGAAAGLVEPRGLALDPVGERVYWVDAARAVVGRAAWDGSAMEELPLAAPAAGFRARPAAPTGAGGCGAVLAQEREELVAQTAKGLRLCLEKVDAHQAVKVSADAVRPAAPVCATLLAGVLQVSHRVAANLSQACATAAARRAAVATLCAAERDDAGHWSTCLAAVWRALAFASVVAVQPRTVWWLDEVAPFVEALPAPAAMVVLHEARTLLAPPMVAPRRGFPATGQTTAFRAVRRGSAKFVAVADDGAVQSGASPGWRDMADGTLLDEATGLLWEKKCDGCGGLHDVAYQARWSSRPGDETIWDWLARINEENGGFAGYRDWRIPNVKELQSLIDYERFNPAVGSSFDGAACGLGCRDLSQVECSCTETSDYWASTTSAADPGRALAVGFHLGLVGDVDKADDLPVRAVRGPLPPPASLPGGEADEK